MPDHKSNLDSNMNKKRKIGTFIGIVCLLLFVIGFVMGLYFFGLAGAFELLGVEYQSIGSLLQYVLLFVILGIVVELISKVCFKLSIRNKTGKINIILTRFSIEAMSNWFVLFTVDELVQGIEVSMSSEIVIAIVLTVIEIVFDSDKNE